MTETIDWNTPITAQRRRTVSLMGGPVSTAGGRYMLDAVRAEQIRRATILMQAAGAPKLTASKAPQKVAALAAVVPGLRYSAGPLIYSGLAPRLSLISTLFDSSAKPTGRPVKWTADMRTKLAEDLQDIRRRKPHLSDTLPALRALRLEWIRDIKERLLAEGKPIDGDEFRALEPPSPATLRNVLGLKK